MKQKTKQKQWQNYPNSHRFRHECMCIIYSTYNAYAQTAFTLSLPGPLPNDVKFMRRSLGTSVLHIHTYNQSYIQVQRATKTYPITAHPFDPTTKRTLLLPLWATSRHGPESLHVCDWLFSLANPCGQSHNWPSSALALPNGYRYVR